MIINQYNNSFLDKWDLKEYNEVIKLQRFVKGASVKVIFQNKKKANGVIQRQKNAHAEIKINNKIYLINDKFVVLSQIK